MVTASPPGTRCRASVPPSNVTIKVTDVDEAPEISSGGPGRYQGPTRVDYAEEKAIQPWWQRTRPPGRMRPSATWRRLVASTPATSDIDYGDAHLHDRADYESMRRTSDMDNTYMVTVTADDRHLHGHPRRDRDGHQRDEDGTVRLSTKRGPGWNCR